MRRLGAMVVLFVAVLLLVGCGPPWKVLRQAVPNPMVGQKEFGVMPIDFAGLRVGDDSEAEYLAEKDQDDRESFLGDKQAMSEKFVAELTSEAAEDGIRVTPDKEDAPFIVRPKVPWMEGGYYTSFVNKNSSVEMTVEITTPDGNVVDEFTMTTGTRATMIDISSGGRLRKDAGRLGGWSGRYLKKRVQGAQE